MKKMIVAGLCACMLMDTAQAGALLYDPEPPADSAYVRVMAVDARQALNIQVDGKPHGARLEPGIPSDYMVIPAGRHRITLVAGDKEAARYDATLDVIAGRAMTIAYGDDAKSPPRVFEDHANANKLKAVLALYPLAEQAAGLDIRSADGKVSVFKGVVPGAMRTLTVNPVKIDLAAFRDANRLTTMSLDMAPGGTYSIMLLPAAKDAIKVQVVQNKVERYTGR